MSDEVRTLTAANVRELAQWTGGRVVVEHDALDSDVVYAALNIPTSEGVKRVREGQLIVRKHDGTFDVFKSL